MKFIIGGILLIIAAFIVWQVHISTQLSQTKISCGGDWSYKVKCPAGTYCKSAGKNSLAGGFCKPYLK